jgi:DMSO/TMAO reductase YedYZ molybdopterin-dependent catalytic subunit
MNRQLSRRELIKGSLALTTLAASGQSLTLLSAPAKVEGMLIPFLDVQPPGKMLRWQDLTDWITPNDQLFAVSHYGKPTVDPNHWQLEITGLVKNPKRFTLAEVKSRRRKTVVALLECSGNSSSPGFMGAVGNLQWTGTPLVSLLRECGGFEDRAIEVAFFGADEKVEKIREKDYLQHFARSLSRSDALRDDVLVAYEMNGQPLTPEHGAPLRLVVPGWFGIAWVKWLTRIELLDRRFMGRFMARDYVTLRGEEQSGHTEWRETSVGPIDVKSVAARAVRLADGTVRLTGAAWTDGTPLQRVQVQIDGGPWKNAQLDEARSQYGWRFWHHDWKSPESGDHTVVSRAIDATGRLQPAAGDPAIELKRSYWEANQQWPRRLRL